MKKIFGFYTKTPLILRIAICDDNAADLLHLTELLMQYDSSIHAAPFSTAQALYESRGFSVEGVRKNYYGSEDALIMIKE